MPSVDIVKTNFTAGEISADLKGRSDLKLFTNGASKLRNVFVEPTGGLKRRPGLKYMDRFTIDDARIVPFEYKNDCYLLVLLNGGMVIYKDDAYVTSIATPWILSRIQQLDWVQNDKTLFFTHPEQQPYTLNFDGYTWSLAPFSFDEDELGRKLQPYYNFSNNVTLQPSGTTGSITITASAYTFIYVHVGMRLRIKGKEVEVTAVASGTSITATVIEDLVDTEATKDWGEPAFSDMHGWPVTIGFHQNRLIFGDARDLPNRLFMSQTGRNYNFDLGEGLDDEAIEFAILSDDANAIRAVHSSKHLLIFTAQGEWMVTGSPLTPANLQVTRQTTIGSQADRLVQPVEADGAVYFINGNGSKIQEFFFNDVSSAYSSVDLTLTAKHLINDASSMSYDSENRLLHIVTSDGALATLTIYRTESVNAWTKQITENGAFKQALYLNGYMYFIVDRGGGVLYLERFEKDAVVDNCFFYESTTAGNGFGGLTHLNGKAVKVVLDDVIYPDAIIADGFYVTPVLCNQIQLGFTFDIEIEPLPPSQLNFASANAMRLTDITLRLSETSALRLNHGSGLRDVPLVEKILPDPQTLWPKLTGDVSVTGSGWIKTLDQPIWRIKQSVPQKFNLLSVTTKMKVN